jgi:hypothetical protein
MREGNMRDPGWIPEVMAKLQALWEKYPGMRLDVHGPGKRPRCGSVPPGG